MALATRTSEKRLVNGAEVKVKSVQSMFYVTHQDDGTWVRTEKHTRMATLIVHHALNSSRKPINDKGHKVESVFTFAPGANQPYASEDDVRHMIGLYFGVILPSMTFKYLGSGTVQVTWTF